MPVLAEAKTPLDNSASWYSNFEVVIFEDKHVLLRIDHTALRVSLSCTWGEARGFAEAILKSLESVEPVRAVVQEAA